jgi:ketosteroid isomerase-like protein
MAFTPDELRERACKVAHALAEWRWDDAEEFIHADAMWWIIGQGELSHARVRELAGLSEGALAVRRIRIIGTVAEGDKVAIEIRGEMRFPDGRPYENTYHHVFEFRDGRIIRISEYFDTQYVLQVFGQDLYERRPPSEVSAAK